MHWIPESGKRCPAECGLETLATSTPCDATCRLYPQNALRISFHCPETMLGTSCDMSVGFSSFECGRVFSSIRSMNRTKCPLMRERAQLPTCPPRSSRGQVQHLQVPVLQRSACRMPSNSIHPALPGTLWLQRALLATLNTSPQMLYRYGTASLEYTCAGAYSISRRAVCAM